MTVTVKVDPAKRHGDGLVKVALCGTGLDGIELDLPFKDLVERLGVPTADALDLLLVASQSHSLRSKPGERS